MDGKSRKTKGRQSLWMCCSTIELKKKKEPAAYDHDHIGRQSSSSNTPGKEGILSAIYGQNHKSKRSSACFCCSTIDLQPETSDLSPYDLSTKDGAAAWNVAIVPTENVKKPAK